MILILFIAVIALFMGYLFGNMKEPAVKVVRKRMPDPEFEKQRREYENFLNYDGTEQS